MIQFKNILFPTDFSTCALAAQKVAFDVATQCQATLYIVHVVHGDSFLTDSEVFHFHLPDVSAQMEAAAQLHLDALVPDSLREKITVETAVLHGTPFREILNFAQEKQVDMIVIATHGRSGLQHLLLGGTSDKVIRQSPCPVLSVRHPDTGHVVPS